MREHQSRHDLESAGDEPHQRSVVPLLESIAQEARAEEMDESNHPKNDRKSGGEYRKGRGRLHLSRAPTVSSNADLNRRKFVYKRHQTGSKPKLLRGQKEKSS